VVSTTQFDLLDSKDLQIVDVSAKGASSFTLTVLTSYASTKGASVSITEIEFRSRQ
jgi:hypothetical protein